MDPVTGSMLVAGAGSIASTIGGLISGNQNYHLQKKIFKWQKQVQQETWNREDNAVQRRAADLNAAGMNRLLAAGSGAAASAPVHVDAPQAPDYSKVGDPLIMVAQQRLQMAKQNADISQTEAQTKLLTGQLNSVTKQNELLQRTIDWYKNHPDTAPNVPGVSSTNAVQAFGDLATHYGERLGNYLGRYIDHGSNRQNISRDEHISRLQNFHMKNGMDARTAYKAAVRQYNRLNP